MGNEYLKTKKYIILIFLLIGSLNCGATAVGYNFIEKINILLNNNFNTKYPIDKIIYLLVALAGILLVINRDLWLVCIEDFTTPSLPGIPTNVVATSTFRQHHPPKVVTITWDPPQNINDFQILRYIVSYYDKWGGLRARRYANPNNRKVVIADINLEYSFEVQAETTSFIKSLPSPKIYK